MLDELAKSRPLEVNNFLRPETIPIFPAEFYVRDNSNVVAVSEWIGWGLTGRNVIRLQMKGRRSETERPRAERNPFKETPCSPINYNGILSRLIASGTINCAELFYQARTEDTSKVKGKIISAGGLGWFFSNGIPLPGLASSPENDTLTTNRFYDHVLLPGRIFCSAGDHQHGRPLFRPRNICQPLCREAPVPESKGIPFSQLERRLDLHCLWIRVAVFGARSFALYAPRANSFSVTLLRTA